MAHPNNTLPIQQASQFFTAESAKLSSLLDLVAAEAASSTDLQCRDQCLELTSIVSDLLHQAQQFSLLAPEEFKGRWLEVQLFAGRSQAVKDAFAGMHAHCMSTDMNAGCKKRSRSTTLGVDGSSVLKRSRSYLDAREAEMDAVMTDLPVRTAAPQSSWQ